MSKSDEAYDNFLDALKDRKLDYNKVYAKKQRQNHFVMDLLALGYEKLVSKIKLRSDKADYLSYENAATIMDHIVLTVSYAYEAELNKLRKQLEAKQ